MSSRPRADRQLRVFADAGEYHPQPEWCENIPHPVEQTRGQTGSGDAYSPGWFEIPLAKGAQRDAGGSRRKPERPLNSSGTRRSRIEARRAGQPAHAFATQLELAARQFVVRRDEGKTVIAGYPWFLDWGRDSLICARGLLAAGMVDEVKQILLTFAKFEKDGTLPNTIHGNDVSNRDTSRRAAVVRRRVRGSGGPKAIFDQHVDGQPPHHPRRADEHRGELCQGHAQRHPHGRRFRADLEPQPFHLDGHELSRRHAARRLSRRDSSACGFGCCGCWKKSAAPAEQQKWRDLADRAPASFEKLFWLEDQGWFADVLIAGPRVIARDATASDALRSNCLFAVSLGLVTGERAQTLRRGGAEISRRARRDCARSRRCRCPCRCRFTATTASC